MKRRIFLLHEGEKLTVMDERDYDSEDRLQSLLANYPDLLGGDQMNETAPRKWLLVEREVNVPGDDSGADRWHLDHLFIDQDGVPTLVEVKRAIDTRIRREVVGQMLDYAANGVRYWPIEHIIEGFKNTCKERGLASDQELSAFLGGSNDPDGFWTSVKENLRAGKIRLLFVADRIPEELRRIVEFLNEQMDPAEVLAVEVKQYEGGTTKALVPRVLGQTADAVARKRVSPERHWDEPSFFAELAITDPSAAKLAERLLAWFRSHDDLGVWWGQGGVTGSFVPQLLRVGQKDQLCAVWTNGKIEFYLQWLTQRPVFSDAVGRAELKERFETVLGTAVSDAVLNRRPNIPLTKYDSDEAFHKLEVFFGWLIARLRDS